MQNSFIPQRSILAETIDMAWPAILESFFVAFAGLVDSYMVSSLGSTAVAAVGLTTQPKFLGLSMFFAANVAISALVARRKGEQKQDAANAIALTSLIFVIISSLLIGISLCLAADPIMRFCGSTKNTHAYAVEYYQIIAGCMIFSVVQMAVNAAQRGAGNTRISMRTNMTSNTINVILNYLLIGGHLGFPALGIRGAAIATVLGTVAGCIISLASILKKDGFISIPYMIRHRIKADLISLKQLVSVGYSVFFEQVLMRIGFMLTAIMAAAQGDAAMAAHQVAMNIMGLTFSFGDGLQAAAVTLIGQSLGAGLPKKAKKYGSACRFTGLLISIVLAFVYFFGARPLFALFFTEEVIIGYGVSIMRMIIFICLFQVSQVIYMGCLRGAGDTAYTAMASTISVTLVRTAGSYIFGIFLGFGILGIWVGVLADQMSRFLFGWLRFKKGEWVNIKI